MPLSSPTLTTLILAASVTAAVAQTLKNDVAPGRTDPYTRDPYITSTGATVPNPGKPQAGPTTPQERAIRHQDNKIDSSICKGC